ncbi:Putative F-box/FBD/LRR-repeat protein At4g13965 [Linum grandiflorum]
MEEQITSGEHDRLTALPEEILIKILTATDTRTAIRSSVFSRCWRHLWKSAVAANLAIDFPNGRFLTLSERHRFKAFVENVLLFRDKEFPGDLDVLSVTIDLLFEGLWSLLGLIFEHGLAHRVRTLRLVLQNRTFWLCPSLVDLWGSVRNLEISDWSNYSSLHGQSCNFLELKTLRLYRCDLSSSWLPDNNYDQFSRIPNLTELELIECGFTTDRPVIISGSKLVSIVLVCSNESLTLHSKVTTRAPKLKYFKCKGVRPDLFTSFELPSLECLDIDVRSSTLWQGDVEKKRRASLDCFRMFRGFCQAERVKLHPNVITELTMFADILEKQESPFKRMQCLELHNSRSVLSNREVFNSLISYFFDQPIPETSNLARIFDSQDCSENDSRPVVVHKNDLMT